MRVGYLKNCSALQVPRFEDRNQRLHRRCPKTPSNTEKLSTWWQICEGTSLHFFRFIKFYLQRSHYPWKKQFIFFCCSLLLPSLAALINDNVISNCDSCSTAFIIGWSWVIFQFCKREEYVMNWPGMCWCGGAMHPITCMDGCDTHSIFLKVKL